MSVDLNPGANNQTAPPSDAEVIQFVREDIRRSREDVRQHRQQNATPDLQHVGVTVDLCKRGIARLPDEIIDLIKDEIDRLAISHNRVQSLPARLAECKRLRYLNIRWNALKEVPRSLLQLTSLEILDLSRNKIRSLPDDIKNLTSLKVLAVEHNKIERLPLCIGEMSSIRLLKLNGNPLIFPPEDVWKPTPKLQSPATGDNEADAQLAQSIRKYLRQAASTASSRLKLQVESDSDLSESTLETPRPLIRIPRSRFPVRPSISGLESSSILSPEGVPPIPSHGRMRSSRDNLMASRPSRTDLLSPPDEGNWAFDTSNQSDITVRPKRHGLVTPRNTEPPKIDLPTPDREPYSSTVALSNEPNPDPIDEAEAQQASNRVIDTLINVLEAIENIVQQLIFRAQALLITIDWGEKSQTLDDVNRAIESAQHTYRDLSTAQEKIFEDFHANETADPTYRVQLVIMRMAEPMVGALVLNESFQLLLLSNVGWILANSGAQGRNLLWLLRQLDSEINGTIDMVRRLSDTSPPPMPVKLNTLSMDMTRLESKPAPMVQYHEPAHTQNQLSNGFRAQVAQILAAQAAYTPQELNDIFSGILQVLHKVVEYSLNQMVSLQTQLIEEIQLMEGPGLHSQQDYATVTLLTQRTERYLESVDVLRSFLSSFNTNDAETNANLRNTVEFGAAVVAPTNEFTELGQICASITSPHLSRVRQMVKQTMKPLHLILKKEVSARIKNSPWAVWLDGNNIGLGTDQHSSGGIVPAGLHRKNPSGGSVPSTPLSAALGPAVQAAVPALPTLGAPPSSMLQSVPPIVTVGLTGQGGPMSGSGAIGSARAAASASSSSRINFNDRFDRYQAQQQRPGAGTLGRRF